MVVSYGNAADIGGSDLLLYMSEDPRTRIIAMYIEGVRTAGGLGTPKVCGFEKARSRP